MKDLEISVPSRFGIVGQFEMAQAMIPALATVSFDGFDEWAERFDQWADRMTAWCERWPKHCGSCGGFGGQVVGDLDSSQFEFCQDCVKRNRCPRCHGKLRYWKARKSNQIQEGGKCPECGWSYECKDDVAPKCPL